MRLFLSYVGSRSTNALKSLGYVGELFFLFLNSLYWLFVAPFRIRRTRKRFRWRATFDQMFRVGVRSIPIAALVIFFVGVILAFQMAYVLKKLGATEFVADVVGVAITRELGPLLTAILMSGYIGAAIAAELGTMKVSEEIMALEASSLNPRWFLVAPRVIATMVMIPCLTVFANFIGIAGGLTVATQLLQMSADLYINRTIAALETKDIITGLIKSEAFAIVIALIACREGLSVEGGAEGVGKSTTQSVVLSIVFIIAVDCFFTILFFFIFAS